MRRPRLLGAVAFLTLVGCADSGVDPLVDDPTPDTLPTPMAGGGLTVPDSSSLAYSRAAPGLTGDRFQLHLDGRAGFAVRFAADSAESDRGLGPAFNQDSCEGCHLRRGRSPGSVLLRLSAGGADAHGGPADAKGFGLQLQDRAIRGFVPEGTLVVQYDDVPGSYPDGTEYRLRRPGGGGGPVRRGRRRRVRPREPGVGCRRGQDGRGPLRLEGQRAVGLATGCPGVRGGHGGHLAGLSP